MVRLDTHSEKWYSPGKQEKFYSKPVWSLFHYVQTLRTSIALNSNIGEDKRGRIIKANSCQNLH